MKYYRFLSIFIIVVFSTLLSGCDSMLDLYDFKEGCYTSSILWSKDDIKEYTLIYCDVKMVSRADYEKSHDNIFISDGFLNACFLFDVRIRKYDMKEFSKINFTNISSYRVKNNIHIYKGNVEYVYNDILINEEFKIRINNSRRLSLHTSSINEDLLYESYAFKLDELRFKTSSSKGGMEYGPYDKAKLSIMEIPEKDPFVEVSNQTQGLYAKQWLQIDFYMYNSNISEFVKPTIFIKGYVGADMYPEKYIFGTGYLMEEDGELLEFSFILHLKNDEDIVTMEVHNDQILYSEDTLFYAEYVFERI